MINASKNLRFLIKSKNIKAQDLDTQIGKKNGSISAYCASKDKVPPIEATMAICNYFKIKVDDFIYLDFEKNLNFIENPDFIELGQVAEPTTEYGNVKIEYRQITTYIERECPATGGKCYFDSLKEANLRIADLEKRLDEKEK
jgi:transcriptional regulator with XRE-family HTH domain